MLPFDLQFIPVVLPALTYSFSWRSANVSAKCVEGIAERYYPVASTEIEMQPE